MPRPSAAGDLQMMSPQLIAALADMALSLGRIEEALMLIDEAFKAGERSLEQNSSCADKDRSPP